MADFDKRYVIGRGAKKIYDDVIFVSERSMKDILSEDLQNLENRYNKQLNHIGVDNEILTSDLKSKDREYKKLHEQYKDLQWRYEVLEQEKKSLERKLEAEVRNSIHLTRDRNSLQWTKGNLQEHIDKLHREHIEEIRKIIDRRH